MRNLLSKFLFCPFKFNSKQLIHLEIYEKNEMKGNFGCFEKSPCALKLKKSWGPFVWLSPQKEKNFFFALIHLKRFSTQARSSSLSLTNITEKILSKNGHCCPFWPFKALVIVFLILHTPQMKNEKRPTPFLTRCRLGSKLAKNSSSTKFVLKMYKK